MSDRFFPTPVPALNERDAALAEIVYASPLGGILTDRHQRVICVSAQARQLLGTDASAADLRELLAAAAGAQPAPLRAFVDEAVARGGHSAIHIVHRPGGERACLQITAAQLPGTPQRWVWWLEDVTAVTNLRQFRLLAQMSQSSGADLGVAECAESLVDAVVEILGLDIAVVTLLEKGLLRPVASRGVLLEDGATLDPRGRHYVTQAIESAKAAASDGSEWDAAEQEVSGDHYVIPLVSAGTVVGTLHLGSVHDAPPGAPGCMQTLAPPFLEALGLYAGAAIGNSLLLEELRAERLKLQTVLDYIPEGVILFTGRGDVLAANAAAKSISERDFVNLNTDRRNYQFRTLDGQVVKRGDAPFFAIRGRTEPILNQPIVLDFGTHQKVLAVSAIPVAPANEDVLTTYIGTFRDITAELERQKERDAFLQIAGHELRNPLTPLTGFLQMLRKQAQAGEEVDADLLLRAENQVARLGRLVDRVLNLSRLERGLELDLQTLDLRELVQSTAQVWQSDPRGVALVVAVPETEVPVLADSDRLQQVLMNLLDNAVKHSPRGSTVEVSVEMGPHGPEVSVRDHGEGIRDEDLPHIFERFYSGQRSTHRGMGIGLYVTRRLVEQHGGTVTVAKPSDGGACFTVTLPSVAH